MNRIEKFKVDIITPVVMGGVEHEPEIRASSIKGVMRWWLRALIGDSEKAAKVENEIFGSTSAASGIKIKISDSNLIEPMPINTQNWEHPLFYFNYNIKNRRAYIENQSFQISFLINSSFSEQNRNLFYQSLNLLSCLGGIGARSRRGYGSIHIKYIGQDETVKNRMIDFTAFKNIDNYQTRISEYLSNLNLTLGSKNYYTLAYIHLYIDKGSNNNGYDDYTKALTSVIKNMTAVRSAKQEPATNKKYTNKLNGIKPIIEDFANKKAKGNYGNRNLDNVVFGLPLSYQSRSLANKIKKSLTNKDARANIGITFNSKSFERMASPLLIKILKIEQKYYPQIAYFDSDLIYNGMDFHGSLSLRHDKKNKDKDRNFNTSAKFVKTGGVPTVITKFLKKYSLIYQ